MPRASDSKTNSLPTNSSQNKVNGKTESKPWWEGLAAIAQAVVAVVTVGLLIVNIFQMRATKEASDTAEKAFRITKQHTEDTDEAIIQVRGEPDVASNVERITLSDGGKMSAHKVKAHVVITKNSLPNNEQIAVLGTIDIYQDELRISYPITKEIAITGMEKADWDRVQQIQEAVVAHVTGQYDNGFDDLREISYCQDFMMQLPHPGNFPFIKLGVLVDCDGLSAYMRREAEIQKQAVKSPR